MPNALKLTLALIACVLCVSCGSRRGDPTKPVVIFSGGHDTDPQDKGRPVVLIAAALDVKPEVFREAFSGVTPAKDGKPTKEEAQRNKAALMKVLEPHGVTKERLDEVSDRYRYKPGGGELWRTRPAQAYAELDQGKIKRIVITDPGYGYSTPPKAVVTGMESIPLKVTIQFDKDLEKNGSVKSIEVE